MSAKEQKVVVYYDGSCPACIRDRKRYEWLSQKSGVKPVCWCDITGKEDDLKRQGINPEKALKELHIKDAQGIVHVEMDAYIVLLDRVPLLKPFAWLLTRSLIRSIVSLIYHGSVRKRLQASGRL